MRIYLSIGFYFISITSLNLPCHIYQNNTLSLVVNNLFQKSSKRFERDYLSFNFIKPMLWNWETKSIARERKNVVSVYLE